MWQAANCGQQRQFGQGQQDSPDGRDAYEFGSAMVDVGVETIAGVGEIAVGIR